MRARAYACTVRSGHAPGEKGRPHATHSTHSRGIRTARTAVDMRSTPCRGTRTARAAARPPEHAQHAGPHGARAIRGIGAVHTWNCMMEKATASFFPPSGYHEMLETVRLTASGSLNTESVLALGGSDEWSAYSPLKYSW